MNDLNNESNRLITYKCPYCSTMFSMNISSSWMPIDEEFELGFCRSCHATFYKEGHSVFAIKDGVKTYVGQYR